MTWLLCLLLRLKSSFYGQLPDYLSHVLALIYAVGEFFFKEMKRWVQSKISSYCFMFGVNQENQEAVWSSGFSFVIPVVRILFSCLKYWSMSEASHHPAFMGNCLTVSHTFLALSTQWMNSPSRRWRRGVSPRFHLIILCLV